MNKVPQKTIINQLAEAVESIWKTGDGCPKAKSSIMKQFENHVLATYQKYRRGDTIPRVRQNKPGTPAQSTSRRSARTQGCAAGASAGDQSVDGPDTASLPSPPTSKAPITPQPLLSKRREGKERKESWMKDQGQKLFDIFSEATMVKVLEEGRCFDSDFYEDQKDPSLRNLVIETVRVRKEFVEAEKELATKKANKFARVLSAFGQSAVVKHYCDNLPEVPDEPDVIEKSPFKTPKEAITSLDRSSILTRNVKRSLAGMMDSNKNVIAVPSIASSLGNLSNKSTQTGSHSLDDISIPAISTRKKPTKPGAKQSSLCHEAYLQAGRLMCAVGNQSPTQAVLNMMIMDTQVYKQKRKLPLTMQKKYQLELKKIKKMKAFHEKESF